jgi:hypothetical protein
VIAEPVAATVGRGLREKNKPPVRRQRRRLQKMPRLVTEIVAATVGRGLREKNKPPVRRQRRRLQKMPRLVTEIVAATVGRGSREKKITHPADVVDIGYYLYPEERFNSPFC